MYKVIHDFVDLADNKYAYKTGDTFPRNGLKVTVARLEELSGTDNKAGFALIKEIVAKKPAKKAKE